MSELTKYTDLIKSFLNNNISASDFESQYLEVFKKNTVRLPHDEYLERLSLHRRARHLRPPSRGSAAFGAHLAV